ncbi:hypothetical protein ACLOJK_041425, partial [Asimina triloba]
MTSSRQLQTVTIVHLVDQHPSVAHPIDGIRRTSRRSLKPIRPASNRRGPHPILFDQQPA